jgi:predicted PurR-regulated permease PerM
MALTLIRRQRSATLSKAGNRKPLTYCGICKPLIQAVEGYLVTPLVMERATSLHPAVVIATIAVLSTAFGLPRTLLAVPATVAAGVLVEELWFRRLEAKDS